MILQNTPKHNFYVENFVSAFVCLVFARTTSTMRALFIATLLVGALTSAGRAFVGTSQTRKKKERKKEKKRKSYYTLYTKFNNGYPKVGAKWAFLVRDLCVNLGKIQGFFTLQLACYIVFTVLSMIVPSILASPCKYRRYNHGEYSIPMQV